MKSEDVLTLAKSGFTAKQIAALSATFGKEAATHNVAPIEQTTPTTPQNVENVATTPTTPQNDILAQILTAIQTNAVNQTEQPKAQSVDEILAEIINPPTITKGE